MENMHNRYGIYLHAETPSIEVITKASSSILDIISAPCGDKVKREALATLGRVFPQIKDINISSAYSDLRNIEPLPDVKLEG